MVGYAFMGAAHSQAWRTAARFFDLPLRPELTVLVRPRRRRGRRGGRAARLGERRDRLARAGRPRRRRPGRHLHPGRHATPRSPSPRWRPASTCCARSRWPTRSPRPRRWPRRPTRPRRAASGRWSASTTAGCRRSRWPAGWSPRAGSATVRHVRAQYLQDWIVDPEFPLSWRLQKEKAGSGALGDIGAHIIDLAQYVTGQPLTGVSGADRDVRQGAPAAAERPAGWPAVGRHRDRAGHRRRRRAVPRPVRPAGRSASFEATRFATGRKNAHAPRDQRLARAASRSTSRT